MADADLSKKEMNVSEEKDLTWVTLGITACDMKQRETRKFYRSKK